MKRIRIIGLCVVAALALSVMAASSASAAEYGTCRLLNKVTSPKIKKGKYDDVNCQVLHLKKGVPQAKGIYEWFPGPANNCEPMKKGEYTDAACTTKSVKAKKGKFEIRACAPNCAEAKYVGVGKPELKGEGGIAVSCEKSEGKNIITGPKSGISVSLFKECTALGKKCGNVGVGEISTFPLELEPYEGSGKVFNRIQNKNGTEVEGKKEYLAVFACEGPGLRVHGKLSAVHTGDVNVMSTNSTDEFAPGNGGEQELFNEKNVGAGWEAAGMATQKATNPLVTVDSRGMEVKSP